MKILKPPSDEETEEAFNKLNPDEALLWSIKGDLPEYAKRAIERGAKNDSEYILNLFLAAASQGKKIIVKFFIEECGIDINAKNYENDYGVNALMISSINGNLDMVKFLIENCADTTLKANYKASNAKNKSGSNILMLASYYGNLEVVKFLVEERGFDINAKNYENYTALQLAIQNGKIDVIEYLFCKSLSGYLKNKITELNKIL